MELPEKLLSKSDSLCRNCMENWPVVKIKVLPAVRDISDLLRQYSNRYGAVRVDLW